MLELLGISVPFFGLIFVGFLSGKMAKIPESGLEWLNFFITYVALPCFLFRLLNNAPLATIANWDFLAGVGFSTYSLFVLVFVGCIIFSRGAIHQSLIQTVGASWANIGYMGPGLALAVFGEDAAVPVALIIMFESTMFLTLVPLIGALENGSEKGESLGMAVREVFRRIFSNPLLLASFLALTTSALDWHPPHAVDQLISYFQATAAPCALFALGVTIALRPVKKFPSEFIPLMVIKLIVHPFWVLGILLVIGVNEPLWIKTAFLLAALPPAATTFIFATQYGVYVERASSLILLGTALSIFTVTAFIYVIETGLLPF